MTRARRRRSDAWLALSGAVGTALAAAAASSGTVGETERAVFLTVNGWPDLLRGPLWGAQTLGVLGVPLILASGALLLRRWRLASGLVLLVPLKLVVEHALLKELVQRERPGSTIPEAILRDVPSAGLAFPSGHAIIAFGIVVLLAPYLRRRWLLALVALAVLNSVARVYLGGHAPLDVLGGAAAGVGIGALLNLIVGIDQASSGVTAPPRRAGRGRPAGAAAPMRAGRGQERRLGRPPR